MLDLLKVIFVSEGKGVADPFVLIRASPAVQVDETGWREDGQNSYIWSVGPSSVRYYEYPHSCSQQVVEELLCQDFQGVLGSDFSAAYKVHQGHHQRCWVHFLRDGHELKEQYPADEQVQGWFCHVKAVYARARACADPDSPLPPAKQMAARQQQTHQAKSEQYRAHP